MIKKFVYNLTRKSLDIFNAHFLSMNEIDALANDLVGKINARGFSPDVVVGILHGGRYPSIAISERLGVPLNFIDISRPRVEFMGVELNDIPLFMRITGMDRVDPILRKRFDFGENCYRNVLLVDDDYGSARTFEIAEEEARKYSSVVDVRRAALLAYERRSKPEFFAMIVPYNTHLMKSDKRFPWKPYSPHFEDYLASLNGK